MRQEKLSERERKEAIARWRERREEGRDPKAVKRRLREIFHDVYKGVAFSSAFAVGWVLWAQIDTAWWIAVPVAVVVGAILWRFRSKRVLYTSSAAVLILAIICTIGIISGQEQTVSGIVTNKWITEGGGYTTSSGTYFPAQTKYSVKVTCQESRTGFLIASIGKQSWNAISVTEQVELSYHAESVLGIWHIGLAVDSVNSQGVVFGGSSGFHGGGWDVLGSVMSLIVGIVPLSILVYQEYLK